MITAVVTRCVQRTPALNHTAQPTTTTKVTPSRRVNRVSLGCLSSAASAGGGGSTPASGSVASLSRPMDLQSTRMANSTTNGSDGVRFSWKGRSHVWSPDQRGRKVLNTAMNQPSPSPPSSARGRLTSFPTAAAATAITTSVKKSVARIELNLGAISTPARPAKVLDRAQANADTRSALIPLNSVMRGLSTTALMARPSMVNRNRAPRSRVPARARAIMASSSRLKRYTPNGS